MAPVLLPSLLSFCGVVVGALIAGVATRINQSQSRLKEVQDNLHELRRTAYSEYARAVKFESQIVRRMAGGSGAATTSNPLGLSEGKEQLGAALKARSDALEAVLLVGSGDTVTAGRVWHHTVWTLRYLVLENWGSLDKATFADVWAGCGLARDAFYAACRRDLAVDGTVNALSKTQLSELAESFFRTARGNGPI